MDFLAVLMGFLATLMDVLVVMLDMVLGKKCTMGALDTEKYMSGHCTELRTPHGSQYGL
jgi:hypothetical protein